MRCTVAPAANEPTPNVEPSMVAPVTSSTSVNCVDDVTVMVKTRFCSNGHVVPRLTNLTALPVVQLCVAVRTFAGLAVEMLTTARSSFVVTSAGRHAQILRRDHRHLSRRLSDRLTQLDRNARGQALAEHGVHARHINGVGNKAKRHRVDLAADDVIALEFPIVVQQSARRPEK